MLTLNLVKLSYTADVPPDAPQNFTWKYIQSDLVLVFDTFRSGSSQSELMRIVQATQILYDIPIEELINEGKELTTTLQRHGAEVKCDQLPVSAIVRSPLLALRYSLKGLGKIRRIQLKFASAQEYDTAISHLRRLGLWMTGPKPGGFSTPAPSVRPQSGGPSCPPSQLSEITNRPFTALSATVPSLRSQPREAASTRPLSARSLNPDPLVPPVYFPRPNSASIESPYERLNYPSTIAEHSPSLTPRPETAILFSQPNAGDVPPRRELPFQRPDSPNSRGSDSTRPLSRPSSSLMGPPPLPPPSRAGARRPSSRASSCLTNELPSLPKPTILGNIHAGLQTNTNTKGTSSRGAGKTARPKSAIAEEQENQLASSPPPYRPATSAGTSGKRPLSAVSLADLNQRQQDPQAEIPTPPTSEATYQNQEVSNSNSGGKDAANHLAAYALQSAEGRMATLNNFILEHLDDDNFLTLVEDMDACWARIAPGLG